MSDSLRVIIVKSWVDDIDVVVARLHSAGYAVEYERVDLEPALWAALDRGPWHVVICDWKTPQLTIASVGRILRDHGTQVPIVVLDRIETLALDVHTALGR